MTSHWMGKLDQGGVVQRLIVHIEQAVDGTLDGTIDNLDVGVTNIPIDVIQFENAKLHFDASAIDGSYKGKIAKDGRTVDGTWVMSEEAHPLILRRFEPSGIDGIWAGTLTHGSIRLRLVFYIANGPDGLIATMKSCDQNDVMISMSSAKLVGRTVVLEAEGIRATLEGKLDQIFGTIDGTWTQGGVGLPLNLKRVADEDDLVPARPQEPSKPYPYQELQVSYRNERAGIELAGTLTVPEGEGPFPAVVLIAGSGRLDRDETMHDHRPFLVLADYLTRHGIAVLRADKRGVGESDGEFRSATTTDFAMDCEAGVAYLETRREIDRGKIGLMGHSEGGLIACMLAARNPDVVFIVLLAAPGVTGWELAGQQARRSAEIHGLNPEEAEQRNKGVAALLRDEKDETILRQRLNQMFSDVAEPQRNALVESLALPWQREMVSLNPADYLAKVKCPVLAINGENDVTVEPKSNLSAIRYALESAGNSDFEVAELPGLNHHFQTCATSTGTEYGQIEETLAPVALEKIVEWIRNTLHRQTPARRA
jgi:uncharacterized protein